MFHDRLRGATSAPRHYAEDPSNKSQFADYLMTNLSKSEEAAVKLYPWASSQCYKCFYVGITTVGNYDKSLEGFKSLIMPKALKLYPFKHHFHMKTICFK